MPISTLRHTHTHTCSVDPADLGLASPFLHNNARCDDLRSRCEMCRPGRARLPFPLRMWDRTRTWSHASNAPFTCQGALTHPGAHPERGSHALGDTAIGGAEPVEELDCARLAPTHRPRYRTAPTLHSLCRCKTLLLKLSDTSGRRLCGKSPDAPPGLSAGSGATPQAHCDPGSRCNCMRLKSVSSQMARSDFGGLCEDPAAKMSTQRHFTIASRRVRATTARGSLLSHRCLDMTRRLQ